MPSFFHALGCCREARLGTDVHGESPELTIKIRPAEAALGVVGPSHPPGPCRRGLTGSRERDQAGVLVEQLAIDARLVVVALDLAEARRELREACIALGLREEGARLNVARSADRPLLRFSR